MNNKFEIFGGVNPDKMTPEQIAADEKALTERREKNLAKIRAEEAAAKKIEDSYDFSDSRTASSDAKIISKEDRFQ